MIVYRCVNETEIANMLGLSCYKNKSDCKNTFKYKEGVNYKHFFYYYDSAIAFADFMNSNRYYDKYVAIMAYDIEIEELNKYFCIGKYELEKIPNEAKGPVLQYFKFICYPEFAIPEKEIKNEMLVGIGDKKRITPVNDNYYENLNKAMSKNEKDYLNYQTWLLDNGTDVELEKIVSDAKKLFPITENDFHIPTIQYTKK